ncbi:hypothetical protein DPMN_066589 [Dreissena polymorpha]|uniref:Uncharacterized protein n=1 Tax=Dreissena polymorpha TaxID=45954 RepID=A0A9D4BT05_DREPO|nr:hypothetical protein DPMN_066589 [Dreissena polymorpha]
MKKLSVRRVALQYSILYQTLRDRISGRVDPNKFLKETIFTHDEKLGLVENAENYARLGYGLRNTAMQKLGGELAHHLGKRDSEKNTKQLLAVWIPLTVGIKDLYLQTISAGVQQGKILNTRGC